MEYRDEIKADKKLDDLSVLFEIIEVCEALEAAYSRGVVTDDDYERECNRLISNFRSTETALISSNKIKDVDSFIIEYNIDCPRARIRLLDVGAPSTTMHSTRSSTDKSDAILVAEATAKIVTVLDALSLGQTAVDELQPLLQECMTSLTHIQGVNVTNSEFCIILSNWLRTLHGMRAYDSINDDQVRQLTHDINIAYNSFMAFLKSK